VLDYDAAKYTVSQVEVRMRRNPSSGLTESAEARWSWAVANGYGEGEAKAKAAARASGMFTPPGGGKRTLKPVHQCKLLSGVQYSLTSRETSSASSPSTNRPVACPVCELYGWSYNMADHVASGSCSGAKDAAAVVHCEPAYHEREWLKPFLGTNMKPRTKACKEPSCPCKRKR
jgi:hypothetical protein